MLVGAPFVIKAALIVAILLGCIFFGAANAFAASTSCVTITPSSPVVGDTVTVDPACQTIGTATSVQWSLEGTAPGGGSSGWTTTVSLNQAVKWVCERAGTLWYRIQLKVGNTLNSSTEGYVVCVADGNGDSTQAAQLARLARANADSNAGSSTVTIGDNGDFVGAVILALGILVFVNCAALIRGMAKRGH